VKREHLMLYKKTGPDIIPGSAVSMPHLDFRHVFEQPSHTSTAPAAEEPSFPVDNPAARQQKRTLATRLPRLHRYDRTTILFAILIFVGGLFCAFYFFNGVENLRAAAAWSREFLYPRPAALAAGSDQSSVESGSPAGIAQNSAADAGKPEAQTNSTAPFSRNLGSLYPSAANPAAPAGSTASLPGITFPSNPGSLLNQLSLPPAGGGTLAQTFDRAVAEVARINTLLANAPLQVVKAPVSGVARKVNAPLKKRTAQPSQQAQAQANTLSRNATTAPLQTARPVDAMRLGEATTVISGSDLQHTLGGRGLGSGSGGIGGGLGGRGGAGGMGGIGGGIGGAIGGAVGGLGGSGK